MPWCNTAPEATTKLLCVNAVDQHLSGISNTGMRIHQHVACSEVACGQLLRKNKWTLQNGTDMMQTGEVQASTTGPSLFKDFNLQPKGWFTECRTRPALGSRIRKST